MKKLQKTVFISYAHEDIDRATLDYIVYVLRDALSPNASILIDQDVRYGDDFEAFMAMIDSVDVVILLLTPAYKRRVLERKGGVYREFTYVYDRYSETRHADGSSHAVAGNDAGTFELLPILFSGTIENSTPADILSLNQVDLTGLRVSRKPNGEFVLSNPVQQKYQPVFRKIASEIFTTAVLGSSEYRNLSDTYYDDLFVDLKASWDRPAGRDYLATQFVKTLSYKQVDTQQAFFVVGRKGSGKSTLTQVLPMLDPERYQATIKIVADKFALESLFELYSDQQFRSDTSTAVSRVKTFEYTWEASLLLALMRAVMTDATDTNESDPAPNPGTAFLQHLSGSEGRSINEWSSGDFFAYCFRSAVEFVKDCVDNARVEPDFFLTDIQLRFNRERFLAFVFGAEILESFRHELRKTDKKFLVTLDGFDTAFDSFRLESIRAHDEAHLRARAHFEIDWLRSLLNLTQRARAKPDNHLYAALEFCIAAPLDRFLEVIQIERDSYRNWSRWVALQWSGIELAILLRKRLEGIASFSTDTNGSPEARLEEILRHKQFKHIPVSVAFDFNGRSYRMPLFMYVLRHTFWRPRDLLYYYARILALAESMKRWGTEITPEAVRKCIKATTKQVIQSEFINELRSSLVDIESILRCFRKSPVVLSFAELRERIAQSEFRFATGVLSSTNVIAKIRFLYDVGFLGLRVNEEQQAHLGVWHEHAFQFNEGPTIFGDDYLEEDDLASFDFVIHPIFCEYLRLDTSGHELTLAFSWEYLYRAEAALIARQGT